MASSNSSTTTLCPTLTSSVPSGHCYDGQFVDISIGTGDVGAGVDKILPQMRIEAINEPYTVEIRHVDREGNFYFVFVEDANKAVEDTETKVRLQNFYEMPDVGQAYRTEPGDLKVGDVIVASVKIPNLPHPDLIEEELEVDTRTEKFIRAKVVQIDPVTKLPVLADLDDFGVYETSFDNRNKIFKLAPRFMRIPAKLMLCKLAKMEFFEGTCVIHRTLEMCPLRKPACYVIYFSGVYDERDVPIVEITKLKDDSSNNLRKYVLRNLYAVLSPYGPLVENEGKGCITSVSATGLLWIRFHVMEWLFRRIDSALSDKIEEFVTLSSTNRISIRLLKQSDKYRSIMYVRKCYSITDVVDKLRRCKVLQCAIKENSVQVFDVDYGTVVNVEPSDLFPLHILSETLAHIPSQALKVQLEGVSMMTATMEDVHSAAGSFDVYCKLVGEWPGNYRPPEVRIYLDDKDNCMPLDGCSGHISQNTIAYADNTLSGCLIKGGLATATTSIERELINRNKQAFSEMI